MKTTDQPESDLVLIGKVGKPHGVKGGIRIFTESNDSEALGTLKSLVLRDTKDDDKTYVVGRAQPADRFWIVRLEGVSGRESAAALTHCGVLVSRSDLPAIDDDEYYVHDLIGLDVVSAETGERTGTIVEIFDNGAHDVIVYQPVAPDGAGDPKSKENKMVPFVEQFVGEVDFESGTVALLSFEIE